MTKSKYISILLGATLFFGCSEPKTMKVKNVTYLFVRGASTNANGIVDVELWKKEGTEDLYTPSLTKNDMIRFVH
jgi:PBP1b-binding outer membrane lipoprotein LpoB